MQNDQQSAQKTTLVLNVNIARAQAMRRDEPIPHVSRRQKEA
jgi:hypothetical protein